MAKSSRKFLSTLLVVITVGQTPRAVAADEPSAEQLYEAGKALFEQFAPEEIKQQYEFPSKEEWDKFAARLQHALESNNLNELVAYENEARGALAALRALPGYEDYADWLQERIDYIEAAKQVSVTPPPVVLPAPKPGVPGVSSEILVPSYGVWQQRIRSRPLPSRASELMPTLRAAFVAEGVPAEVAWIAEAESTLNPAARSPAGAKGLFQFMPETAKGLGLSTFMPDERADVEKSAHAAARYLRSLHQKFGDWPLAFAAYNAGEGRVRRLLKQRDASTFASIASALPSETRMYVPKVCATIAVRAGVSPEKLPLPRAAEG
jgi:membrane-bound lytic murein transglycosylase D